jgi:murein DD-endopeptidase MepM/ murein hydrolase activator NlpD
MSKHRRAVTVSIHWEGDPEGQVYKMPAWLFKTLAVASVVFVVLVGIAAVLYTPIVRTAARVPGLNAEIVRLTDENNQVQQLAATLEELENRYNQIRTVLGAEIIAEPEERRVERPDGLPVLLAIAARVPEAAPSFGPPGPSLPLFWPLDSLVHGVVTRGFSPEDADRLEPHPGIDIAVPRGTPIRAAGGGVVAEASFHPEYGLFVLIDHPDGYRTMYGHTSRLLASAGASVDAGQVIALSGNTGRSTAPHLHFEKRRGDLQLDPRTTIGEDSQNGEEGRS